MYFDKDNDLKIMNSLYKKHNFHFVNLYSKGRMGKSTFLSEFAKDKKYIYFSASDTVEKENLFNLSKAVLSVTDPYNKMQPFESFEELFNYLTRVSSGSRLLLILDEYQSLARSSKTLNTLLEKYVKYKWQLTQLFLIICNPPTCKVEGTKYEKRYPLDGKETLRLSLRPFSFFETTNFVGNFTMEEQVFLYGITSGIPGYLKLFQNDNDMKENIINLFFDDHGALFHEPTNLLRQEFREPSTYHTILSAIGDGKRKLHEISEITGLATGAVSNLLNSLVSMELVQKVVPITEPDNSRRTYYVICDGVFRFWYTFVAPNISDIVLGNGRHIYDEQVVPRIKEYTDYVFEIICRQYLELEAAHGGSPFTYHKLGTWWGQHPTKKRTNHIAIAASDEKETNILLANCFYTDDWIDINVLYDLMQHSTLFPHKKKWYYLFAKSEFAAGLEALTENSMRLVTLDKMLAYYNCIK